VYEINRCTHVDLNIIMGDASEKHFYFSTLFYSRFMELPQSFYREWFIDIQTMVYFQTYKSFQIES